MENHLKIKVALSVVTGFVGIVGSDLNLSLTKVCCCPSFRMGIWNTLDQNVRLSMSRSVHDENKDSVFMLGRSGPLLMKRMFWISWWI